jgi:hypothetical protein
MKTFTDNAGRTWAVQINVDAIKRVKDLAGVNLLEAIEGKLVERLVNDPVLLCDVVYALVKDQHPVSDGDFGRAMAGDAIDGATAALLEELVDFFPLARRRALSKALAKYQKLQATAMQAVESRLDSPELEQKLLELLNRPIELPGI